jgi:hypothetical protein
VTGNKLGPFLHVGVPVLVIVQTTGTAVNEIALVV